MNQESFRKIVKRFEATRDENGIVLNMHYLSIKQGDDIYSHRFKEKDSPSDIRSISKTVLTMVAIIVMDLSKQGKYPSFDWDTNVFPILSNTVNLTNKENKVKLDQIKVKHLLNHTVGYDKVLLMRNDIVNLDPYTYLDYLINTPIEYDPGKHYLYSNAGFYILSAVLQEFIQEDLLSFIHRHLFKPLNIKNYRWEKYGIYLAGATRLWMCPDDLLKLGTTLLNKGLYNGKRIVSSEGIEKMLEITHRTNDVDTSNAIFRKYAYGSGIWLSKGTIFFGNGTDGQNLIIIPEKNSIVVTLASQKNVGVLEKLINEIITDCL